METYCIPALWCIVLVTVCRTLPVLNNSLGIDGDVNEELQSSVNDSPTNLYVVKAAVYEIGILTEVDDNDTNSFESQERVDLTFFDAHTNESHIDLGNIPLPIQTNVSGQVLTGIAPINLGAFSSASELLQALPLTGTIINITHSDTAFYKLTTSNNSDEAKPRIISTEDNVSIPQAAGAFHTSVPTPVHPQDVAVNSLESRQIG